MIRFHNTASSSCYLTQETTLKKCQAFWYMGGDDEGAACESIAAASQSLREHKYHLVVSKMDPRAVSPRFGAADFVRFAKWHILRGGCRVLQSRHNCSMKWGGGGGRIHSMGEKMKTHKIKHQSFLTVAETRKTLGFDGWFSSRNQCISNSNITLMESAIMKNRRASSPWTTTEKDTA